MDSTVYLFALMANICFALGSQGFTFFSRKISSSWMNWLKCSVALFAFGVYLLITNQFGEISLKAFLLLFFSGFLALGAGDIFLLKAFSDLGPGRTLTLFSFQPLFLGIAGFYIFDQAIDTQKLWAIIFFIICIVIYSLEKYRKDGHWNFKYMLMAFIGMGLDAFGVIVSRYVFDQNVNLTPMEGNFYRCIGAVSVFVLLRYIRGIKLIEPFKALPKKEKLLALGASFIGTFLSLSFYLTALRMAHLGSLSGIAITGTIFASLFECILEKKLPSRYLMVSFISFLIGMKILLS